MKLKNKVLKTNTSRVLENYFKMQTVLRNVVTYNEIISGNLRH